MITVIAIKYVDGIVIESDSQLTSQLTKKYLCL